MQPQMILKFIPNALTVIRLVLIIPFLGFLSHQKYAYAFYIFIFAGFTDGLDGWLARHFSWKSVFGSFVDPLADKLLVTSSFFALAILGSLPWWLVILVLLRDACICLGVLTWYWFIQKRLNFEPTLLSKLNTTFQLSLVTLCLFELAYFQFPSIFKEILIGLTALTTSITYFDYFFKWFKRFFPKKAALE